MLLREEIFLEGTLEKMLALSISIKTKSRLTANVSRMCFVLKKSSQVVLLFIFHLFFPAQIGQLFCVLFGIVSFEYCFVLFEVG